MRYCCSSLKDSFDSRHERGLFVFVRPSMRAGAPPVFAFACRSVLPGDHEQLQQIALSRSAPITLTSQQAIRFCPWCGVILADFYKDTYGEMMDEVLIAEFGLRDPS